MATNRINKAVFFKDLGYEPHAGQRDIHQAPHPRRVVACGVRWGKTTCAAMEGLAAAMNPAPRSVGWVCAPTYDLADRVFREIQLVASTRLRHRLVTLRDAERKIVLRNMGGGLSEIRGKSADNPVSLLGEGLDWLIIDEASRLKPEIWQSHLSQRLIDKKGWALLISTPRGKGYFYDLFRRGQGKDDDYKSWNYASWTNPMLDRALIEQERARLPERIFMQEYGGEFLEGAGSVFRFVRDRARGFFKPPAKNEGYYGGLDLAKVEDYTVLVLMNREREVVFVDRFHRVDWAVQIERIKAATDRFNEAVLTVDTTGPGEPVFECLLKAGVQARAYPFTARSKTDLVNNLAMMLERDEIVLPRPELWPEGIEELEAFEYAVTDQGAVRSSAPAGQHDDCVMALALAAWAARTGVCSAQITTVQRHSRPLGSTIWRST